MTRSADSQLTVTRLLVPVSILAFTLMMLFAFQTTQILKDRDALHVTMGRLEGPFTDGQRLNTQFGGLVVGAQRLAAEGHKDVQPIVERLKQIGVIQPEQPQPGQPGASPAPIPAASEPPPPGPVKP